MPWPPPMHWVDSARPLPSRLMMAAALPVMRAPVAPSGWPMAMRAAVDIGPGPVEAEIVDAGERLDGEGLVQLDDIDVLDRRGPARFRAFCVEMTGPMPISSGAQPATAAALIRAMRLQPMGLGVVLAHHQHRRGAVGQRRGRAGGHRALLLEGGLQVGEDLQVRARANAAVLLDPLVARGDGDQLVGELARRFGRGSPGMAVDGELLLPVAGNLVLAGEILRRLAHGHVGGGLGGQFRMRQRVEPAHGDRGSWIRCRRRRRPRRCRARWRRPPCGSPAWRSRRSG